MFLMDNLRTLLQPVIDAVQEVGGYIDEIKKERRFVDRPKDLANYADQEAHILFSKLLKIILDIAVVSEEDLESQSRVESLYWLIDPIDGTSSYSQKYNGYVVQCALMDNNKPTLSVIYAPHFKKTYYAIKGGGAWLNGVRILSEKKESIRSLVDNEPSPHDIAEVVYKKMNFERYIESGSLGLKMCLVAEGIASAFVKSTIIRDWDVAPASLLLKEVNGCFADSYLNEITYMPGPRAHTGLIATSNIQLQESIGKIIAGERENGRFQ